MINFTFATGAEKMSSDVQQGLKLRVFVGCLIDSEVRMHLAYSDVWKREQVIRTDEGETLDKIKHEEKEYVGHTIDHATLSLDEVHEHEQYVRRALSRYCPELDVDKFKISVISQLFLA